MTESKYNELKTWVEAGTPQTPRHIHIVIQGASTEGEATEELVHMYDPAVETGLNISMDEYMTSGIDTAKWDAAVAETKARAQVTIDRIDTYSNPT